MTTLVNRLKNVETTIKNHIADLADKIPDILTQIETLFSVQSTMQQDINAIKEIIGDIENLSTNSPISNLPTT